MFKEALADLGHVVFNYDAAFAVFCECVNCKAYAWYNFGLHFS